MLKKFITSAICICVISSFSVGFAEANNALSANLFIPKGTQIAVELTDSVRSQSTFIGETLIVEVLEDYIVNNVVVIERGSKGFVSVIDKKRSGEWGKAGGVVIRPQYIKTANWVKVPLDGTVSTSGEGHAVIRTFAVGAAGIAGFVKDVPGVGAAFASLFLYPDSTPGGEASIPAGTKFIVSVSENTDLGIGADELVKSMTIEPIRRNGGQSSNQTNSSVSNFSGQWMTSKGKITIYQGKGSQSIIGRFENNGGTLTGAVRGNCLTGRWDNSANGYTSEVGKFEMLLSGNGENVMVLWKRDSAPNWSQDRYANKLGE